MERIVKYVRHEFHHEPETREAPLWAFLHDVPYLSACDVFPPRHLLNVRLTTGGGDGGMGPGASWTPFEISESEYTEVLPKVLEPDKEVLARYARYTFQRLIVDPELDHYIDYFTWYKAACDKHRAAFHSRLEGNEG